MNHFLEVLIFIAGAIGYNLKGRIGAVLVSLILKLFKMLFRLSEQEIALYLTHKNIVSKSGKLRAR